MIVIKSAAEIAKMRKSGLILAQILAEIGEQIKPGMTTAQLDQIASRILAQHQAESPFLGYPNRQNPRIPFPAHICTSVNEEIVHGIPGKRRLVEGDVVSVDCGVRYQGWIADGAWTFAVGRISPAAERLLKVTEQALLSTIAVMQVGARTGDVGYATQQAVEPHGFQVLRNHTSHGVGRSLHEDPQIYNYGTPGQGVALRAGMTIAVEPMVLAGSAETIVLADGWTVAAADKCLTAHFEHTVAVTADGPQILTCL
jgi:methionyl aminopeptidase